MFDMHVLDCYFFALVNLILGCKLKGSICLKESQLPKYHTGSQKCHLLCGCRQAAQSRQSQQQVRNWNNSLHNKANRKKRQAQSSHPQTQESLGESTQKPVCLCILQENFLQSEGDPPKLDTYCPSPKYAPEGAQSQLCARNWSVLRNNKQTPLLKRPYTVRPQTQRLPGRPGDRGRWMTPVTRPVSHQPDDSPRSPPAMVPTGGPRTRGGSGRGRCSPPAPRRGGPGSAASRRGRAQHASRSRGARRHWPPAWGRRCSWGCFSPEPVTAPGARGGLGRAARPRPSPGGHTAAALAPRSRRGLQGRRRGRGRWGWPLLPRCQPGAERVPSAAVPRAARLSWLQLPRAGRNARFKPGKAAAALAPAGNLRCGCGQTGGTLWGGDRLPWRQGEWEGERSCREPIPEGGRMGTTRRLIRLSWSRLHRALAGFVQSPKHFLIPTPPRMHSPSGMLKAHSFPRLGWVCEDQSKELLQRCSWLFYSASYYCQMTRVEDWNYSFNQFISCSVFSVDVTRNKEIRNCSEACLVSV